jgi:integrase
VTLRAPDGTRRDVYLGPYDSAESKIEYNRVLAEHQANIVATLGVGSSDITVNEVLLAFWRYAENYYTTTERNEYKYSLRPVRQLYGHTPARSFGPIALKTVRERMIASGWSRGLINQRIGRIRRVFKWAVGEELIAPSVLQALQAVTGLKRGKSPAKEKGPVRPVPDAFVDAVRPFVSRHVWGLIEFQRLTGCRPGEAVRLRGCDIDMTGATWVYRPPTHKTSHLGRDRAITIGPRGQALVKGFLVSDVIAYVFSPKRAREEWSAAQRAGRRTPVQPSQANRRKQKPKRAPGERYSVGTYARAIANACRKAGVPHWHPLQLRHTFATEIRRQYGLEPVQALLGHERLTTSQIYAEKNLTLAERIAGEVG